jgi:hypothetical protein
MSMGIAWSECGRPGELLRVRRVRSSACSATMRATQPQPQPQAAIHTWSSLLPSGCSFVTAKPLADDASPRLRSVLQHLVASDSNANTTPNNATTPSSAPSPEPQPELYGRLVAYTAEGFARSKIVDRLHRIVAFAGAQGLPWGLRRRWCTLPFTKTVAEWVRLPMGGTPLQKVSSGATTQHAASCPVFLLPETQQQHLQFLTAWADKYVATFPVVNSRKYREVVASLTAREAARDAARCSTHPLSTHSVMLRCSFSRSIEPAETELMGGMRTSCCEYLRPTMRETASKRHVEGGTHNSSNEGTMSILNPRR